MPRRLRIESEGAIDHVVAQGTARQKIGRDDADRRRLIDGLEHTVVRCGWELLCCVIMGNHLHLVLKTPRRSLGAKCSASSRAMRCGLDIAGGDKATCSRGSTAPR